MKSFLKATVAALFATLALSAHADAGDTYKSNNDKVFSVATARKVELVSGYIVLTYANGQQSATGSAGGFTGDTALFNKIQINKPSWVVYGGALWDSSRAKSIICSAGKSIIGWADTGAEELTDGCAFHIAAVGKTTP